MYSSESGHIGEDIFWSNGRLEIYRYCDGVFELRCDGTQVLPIGTFERINRYLWLEFAVMGTL